MTLEWHWVVPCETSDACTQTVAEVKREIAAGVADIVGAFCAGVFVGFTVRRFYCVVRST